MTADDTPSRQAPLRHPRLQPLGPRRRHPGRLRQIAQAIKTRRQRPAPAHPRIRLEFLGNVRLIERLDRAPEFPM